MTLGKFVRRAVPFAIRSDDRYKISMRQPPPIRDLPKFPVTGGTILLAIGVTLAWWSKAIDMSPLMEDVGIRRGELWRLLTCSLLHANFLHLAFNLYWTWVFGTLIESVFGHLRTLGIFVLLAVVANGGEYALLAGGVGLSGIGYGLFGLMWAMSKRDRRFSDAVDPKTVQLFVVWFFICVGMTVAGYPIANIAHGLGCVTGLLLGWTITAATAPRIAGAVYILVLTAMVLVADTAARPWVNVSKYVGGEFAKEAGGDEARLGYAAITAHDDQSAIRWYRDAVRMDPTDASSWFNLGIAYQRTAQQQSAVAAYQKACDLNPSDSKYRSALDSMQ